MKLEPRGALPSFPSLLYTLTAPPGPPDPPAPGELVGVSPSSLAGRAATRGTDRMTPFPVPTQRRSLVNISDVIRTNENPNLPVPEEKATNGKFSCHNVSDSNPTTTLNP